MASDRTVLFICTGNYYRSRFAEALFNHHARLEGLRWHAFSRGMALYLPQGAISPHVVQELIRRGIDPSSTAPYPVPLTEADLERADVRIALYEPEHRPMIRRFFPGWQDKVMYWQVPDLGEMGPEEGMALIESHVRALVGDLNGEPQNRESKTGIRPVPR